MRGEAWTAEQLSLLKQLWAEGETASTIGARLGGLSRSAVLGKIFRLRLGVAKAAPAGQKTSAAKAEGKPPRPSEANAEKARAAPPAKKDSPTSRPIWRRNGARREELVSRQSDAAAKRSVTLMDLTNDTCRWPYRRPGTKRYFFCGAPGADLEQGIPYCARHARRAYVSDAPTAAEIKHVALKRLASRLA